MKKPKQIVKAGRLVVSLTERDYRGIIAIILVLGLIIVIAMENLQGAAVIGTLAGSAVSFYFSEKRGERDGE